MKKVIEDLWYSYVTESLMEQTQEEKETLIALIKSEDELLPKLNEEQRGILKKYEDYLDKLNDISARNAFIKGIRFATVFLIEALYIG